MPAQAEIPRKDTANTPTKEEYYKLVDRKERQGALRYLRNLLRKTPDRTIEGHQHLIIISDISQSRRLPTTAIDIFDQGNKARAEVFFVDRNNISLELPTGAHTRLGIILPVEATAFFKKGNYEYQSILETLVAKIKQAQEQEKRRG